MTKTKEHQPHVKTINMIKSSSPEKTDAEQAQGVHPKGGVHRNHRRGARVGYFVKETGPREQPGSHHRNKAYARQSQNLVSAKKRAKRIKKNKHRGSVSLQIAGWQIAGGERDNIELLGSKGIKLLYIRQTQKNGACQTATRTKKSLQRRCSVCRTSRGGKCDNNENECCQHSTHSVSKSIHPTD